MILRDNPWLKQFVKFCLVGLFNVLVDFTVYLALTRLLGLYFILANFGSFTVGVTVSFLINKKITFKDNGNEQAKKYFKFFIANGIGLLINTTLLYLFFTYGGFNDLIAKIFAIILTTFWNFNISKYWVFRNKEKLAPPSYHEVLRKDFT